MARPKKETAPETSSEETSEEVNEENAGDSSLDIAGTEQEEALQGSPPVSALPDSINSEEEAAALIKAKYKVPEGVEFALVTSDKQVFWQENASSAQNHAVKNDLKLFRIQCQDFQK